MIHKPQKLYSHYFQAITPDNISPDEAYLLYDQNGDFIREFETLQALIDYVTHLTDRVQ